MVIHCGLCGSDFQEDRAQPACQQCPLATACRALRCPVCGYDNPITPAWIATLRRWIRT